jgi:hypothetical protein
MPSPAAPREPDPPRLLAVQTRSGATLDQLLRVHLTPSARDLPALRKEVVAMNPEAFLHRNPDRLLARVTLRLPQPFEPDAAPVETTLSPEASKAQPRAGVLDGKQASDTPLPVVAQENASPIVNDAAADAERHEADTQRDSWIQYRR